MARPRLAVPKYKHHKASGRAFCTRGKRYIWLGKYGSPESKEAFLKLLAELDREREQRPIAAASPVPIGSPKTVSEVADVFEDRCLDGYSRSETKHYESAISVLIEDAGGMKAVDFGPRSLSEVRDAMLAKGWTREHINAQVRRVRAVFRWAESMELVPIGKWHQLRSLAGLKVGAAPAQQEVKPVEDWVVEATLPFMSQTVATMVRVQRLTGCRPQDVCNLHADDIDRSAKVWVFRPGQHKGKWRGQTREVYIGPKAQELIADRLGGGYVFSPRQAWDERRSGAAKTRRWRGYERKGPPANVKDHYGTRAYDLAVERAVDRANAVRSEDDQIAHWRPNQLRHAAGTEFREKYGLDVAQKLLGHKMAKTTERYAKPVDQSAIDAAGEAG